MARLLNELIGGPAVDSYNDNVICNTNTQQKAIVFEKTLNEEYNFEVFPNPSSDKVIIRINIKDEPIILKVYDINGKLVKERRLNSISTELNISDLNSGLLIFEIQDLKNNVIQQQKVIKIN